LIPKILNDSTAGERGWCMGTVAGQRFIAQTFLGHQPTGIGQHIQVLWSIADGGELVLVGVVDSASTPLLMSVVRSLRLRGQ
jgi:hypothetical protein